MLSMRSVLESRGVGRCYNVQVNAIRCLIQSPRAVCLQWYWDISSLVGQTFCHVSGLQIPREPLVCLSPLAGTSLWLCVHLSFWSIHLEASFEAFLGYLSSGQLLAPRSWFLPLKRPLQAIRQRAHFLFCLWNGGGSYLQDCSPTWSNLPRSKQLSASRSPL